MPYEKTFEMVAARRESEEIVVLELLDKASTPSALKSAVLRLGVNDFLETFGDAQVGSKVKVSLEVVEKAKKPSGS